MTKARAASFSPPRQSSAVEYPLTQGSGGYWLVGLKGFEVLPQLTKTAAAKLPEIKPDNRMGDLF